MGITPVEFDFLKAALDSGHFATVKTVLEFGESNTHNLDMRQAIPALVPEGEVREAALAAAEAARANDRPGYPWARQLYGLIFKGAEYTAIDLDPKPPSSSSRTSTSHSISVGGLTSASITVRPSTSSIRPTSTRPCTIIPASEA